MSQKNPKHNLHKKSNQQLSRRDMLKLLGGTGATLMTGLTIGSLFYSDDRVQAQDGMDTYSHSNDTAPDYGIVFPQDAVNSIVITISPENWQAVQDDLTSLVGIFGQGRDRGGFPDGDVGNGDVRQPPQAGERPEGFQPPPDGERPQDFQQPGGGFADAIDIVSEDPIWVPVTVTFNDEVWTHVGFRYKGNSSLSGAWGSGSLKIGFKLNFDKYEDDYPEIDNQRFFGFDEISFSSNYQDPSYLHEKVAADIFRDAGVAAAYTAFYAISLDYGNGPQYIGLYTAVEEVDDTVLGTQFGNDNGNLYKPEGTGAAFVAGTFDEASFEKKNNEDEADFNDILALFDALHADIRLSDPETWRRTLETVFDVDAFLQWLAINTLMQNWDVYGSMAHNYYLYNNPSTGLLTWIPWDHNEALTSGRGGGRGNRNNDSFDLTATDDHWPLISYLMNDGVYHDLYVSIIDDAIQTVFIPDRLTPTLEMLHELVAPYVTGAATGFPDTELQSADAFSTSLSELVDHISMRYELAQTYVSSQ